MNTNPFPRLLDNSPCGKDLFEGKSQELIASNIANVVLNEPNCKVIGLDGGWGSGKSNVVYQVREKLRDSYHFFIYDAWGHQEDLQRRAILEELTDNLIHENLLPASWSDKLKKLMAKTRETETKSIPKLSNGIIFSGLAIILTPISKVLSEALPEEYIILKLLIVFFPILILAFTVNYYYRKEKSLKGAFSKMFIFYQDKQREETTFETISEDEPSVKKFKDWIQDISKDLNKKGIVLVFDNMDRLPQAKVQQLWSSIHIFFAESKINDYKDKIKVIVPFDREHIKSAFKHENIESIPGSNNCFGNDFIDKTFNVVYRVSPPIMIDWKNYFKERWEEAFGLNNNEDFDKIVQIFDLLSEDITPRKIIAFINEFVTIKSAHVDVIPDKYIALFIFGKHSIKEHPIQNIIMPSYLKSLSFLYENDEEMPKYISALYYQVPAKNAVQVVFTEKLKKALNEKIVSDLLPISDVPNFYNILENAIAEVSNYQNALIALNNVPDEKIGTKSQREHIWNCIYRKVQPVSIPRISDWQEILIAKLANKENFALEVVESMLKSEKFDVIGYVESIDVLYNNFNGIFNKLKTKFIPVEDWVNFIRLKEAEYKKYLLKCKQSELDEYLSKFDYSNLSDLGILSFVKQEYKLKIVLDKIVQLIDNVNSDNEIGIEEVEIIFNVYKQITDGPLSKLLDDSTITSYFDQLDSNDNFYYDLLAMRIARLSKFSSEYDKSFEGILTEEFNSDTIKGVANKIEDYLSFGNLLLGLETFNKPLYVSLVEHLIDNPNVNSNSRITISSILAKFDIICDLGKLDREKLIKTLNVWAPNDQDEINYSNVKSYASINFVRSSKKINNLLTDHITRKLAEYLSTLDLESWITSLSNDNSYEFLMLLELNTLKTPQLCVEAIKEVLLKISKQEIAIPDKTKWTKLIERLETENKGLITAFNNVRDIFIARVNITVELFDFFGYWLFKYSKLEEKKESLRTIFKSEIVRINENLELILLNKILMLKIIEKAQEEAADFKEIIQDVLNSTNNTQIEEFALLLGLKKAIQEEVSEVQNN